MNSPGYVRIDRSQINNDHINKEGKVLHCAANHWDWKEVKEYDETEKKMV